MSRIFLFILSKRRFLNLFHEPKYQWVFIVGKTCIQVSGFRDLDTADGMPIQNMSCPHGMGGGWLGSGLRSGGGLYVMGLNKTRTLHIPYVLPFVS